MNTPLTAEQIKYLPSAINTAVTVGQAYVKENPENPANWFPCGFVWATYRCRKNSKEGKVLAQMDFRWDDYAKHYSRSFYELSNTQAMTYREGVLTAVVNSLRDNGYDFRVESKID
jgi:hypothetical protein